MPVVLDASAFLAYNLGEPGADVVAAALQEGAAISAVNLVEVLTYVTLRRPDVAAKLAVQVDRGTDPTVITSLGRRGGPLLPPWLAVEPFTRADAVRAAALVPHTRAQGLSLGDRACLALARRLGWAVLTADRQWSQLDAAAIGVEVRPIR